MKKVVIGVLVVCTVLGVLPLLALGAGVWWIKGKVDGAVQVANAANEQSRTMAELDRAYPFHEPAGDEPLGLDEGRLLAYLAIRDAMLPDARELEAIEARRKQLEERPPDEKERNSGNPLDVADLMLERVMRARASFVKALGDHRMSPREFHAIADATAESELRVQSRRGPLAAHAQREAAAPDAAAAGGAREQASLAVNDALFEKYRERLHGRARPALDRLLLTDLSEVE